MKLTKRNIIITLVVLGLIGLITTTLGVVLAFATGAKGYGEIVTRNIEVGEFSKIDFEGVGDLNIYQGDAVSLEITAGEDIFDNLRVEVVGETLIISQQNEFNSIFNFGITEINKMDLVVTNLDELTVTGVGDVDIESLVAEEFKLTHTGLGTVDLAIQTNLLEVKQEGIGETTVTGIAETQVVDFDGIGAYDGQDLETKSTTLDMDGIGEVIIWATENLDIDREGIGSVYYYGEPMFTNVGSAGIGGVIHKGKK